MLKFKQIGFIIFCLSTLLNANLIDGKKAFDKKEYKKAFDTFFKVAQDGMVAKYNLGFMYEMGLGVKKDIKKAISFYKLSANDGYSLAQNILANAYLKGIGVKQNINLAITYYKLAAKQGNKAALSSLKAIDNQIKKQKALPKAYLTIRSNMRNDKVYVDGKFVGSTKITVPVVPNIIHKVEVRKDGYKTYKFKDVILKPKQKRTIRAVLRKGK